MGEHDKVIITVEKQGSLYFLLNAFLGAVNKGIDVWQRSYDRRTDVMLRIAQADPRIAAMIKKLDTAGNALDESVKANQPNKGE